MAAWVDERQWQCRECGSIIQRYELLKATHPFQPRVKIFGCPICFELGPFDDICDEPGCKNIARLVTLCGASQLIDVPDRCPVVKIPLGMKYGFMSPGTAAPDRARVKFREFRFKTTVRLQGVEFGLYEEMDQDSETVNGPLMLED